MASLSIRGDRRTPTVILRSFNQWNDYGFDINFGFDLPAGFGDCMILDTYIRMMSGSTGPLALVAGTQSGVSAEILQIDTDGASLVDIVGVAQAYQVRVAAGALLGFAAHIIPDTPILFKTGEFLTFQGIEWDTNAAPTGDLTVLVRVVPLRTPPEGREMREFRLTS